MFQVWFGHLRKLRKAFMDRSDTVKWPDFHKAELQFRRSLETLPVAAYTCDPDGLITYYNEAAALAWGRKPALNHPVDRYCGSLLLFSPNGISIDHENCWMGKALREEKDYVGHEVVVERPDGTRRTMVAHAHTRSGTMMAV